MEFEKDTRGMRNNNPGNIRHGEPWRGLASTQFDDDFCVFRSVDFGIRAIYRVLCTYKNAYEIVDIRSIIYRYAPTNENHTEHYVRGVVQYVNERVAGCVSDTTDIWKRDIVDLVIMGIIYFENGFQPFDKGFVAQCMTI